MIKVGKAAKMLGVSIQTLHKWEATGELLPDRKSKAGTRYYDAEKLLNLNNENELTIGYAR
ncbi:resolvase, partial [Achromatium sp. WMS3]